MLERYPVWWLLTVVAESLRVSDPSSALTAAGTGAIFSARVADDFETEYKFVLCECPSHVFWAPVHTFRHTSRYTFGAPAGVTHEEKVSTGAVVLFCPTFPPTTVLTFNF